MTDSVDRARLHELVKDVVLGLHAYSHKAMDAIRDELGLLEPTVEDPTLARRAQAMASALQDTDVVPLARRILELRSLSLTLATRFAIQDTFWAADGFPEIPKKARHELARSLDLSDLVRDAHRFMALLDSLWVVSGGGLDIVSAALFPGLATKGLRDQIDQHVFRNPGDWTTEYLFEQLGAFAAGDRRFALFLEGLVSPDLVPDEPVQRSITDTMNEHLLPVGVELRETGSDGGYPVFSVVALNSPRGRPKNIIFASPRKPDIRFRDALDNDIEIASNPDDVLIYDRPIGSDGVRWQDLQNWWKDTRQIAEDDEAKTTLYQRLTASLPKDSPPQYNLYRLYHEIHGNAILGLPALLPEVWLHWDPKTVQERGPEALLRFRMDFLLLLPHGPRIVIEVDGQQHYTGADGRPSPAKYGDNVRSDRDLRLAGYEVFRFGGSELHRPEPARVLLQRFFADLFHRYNVRPTE
ncbi:hypothetical protein KGQ19_22415 [Catenulispora sp. NL8]|uniref:AbiJ-NTD3 domain-containing protein n=1 Tax=Catenulispora pinistramenti TaxID=2705254 RepID=A0ABS5KU87_9ACTN|nr:hypothetical protein [Catenulispora pinistramenti]MBS2549622.1 hypothetical protein [Catenulispora pinistramenti]